MASLPPGWEERVHHDGRHYFVNHTTKTTSWARPGPVAAALPQHLPVATITAVIPPTAAAPHRPLATATATPVAPKPQATQRAPVATATAIPRSISGPPREPPEEGLPPAAAAHVVATLRRAQSRVLAHGRLRPEPQRGLRRATRSEASAPPAPPRAPRDRRHGPRGRPRGRPGRGDPSIGVRLDSLLRYIQGPYYGGS